MNFIRIFLLLCAVSPLIAEDEEKTEVKVKSPWEFSGGLSGTESLNTGSSAETFYWGPFFRGTYEFSDPLRARLGVRNTQNKFIYDGLGGIARQSNTAISPALNWEITESISIDAEYTYRFGENAFSENGGVLAFEYAGLRILRLSIDGYYNQQSFRFPVSETKVSVRGFGGSLEAAFLVSKQIEIPLLLSYMSSRYNTNGTTYNARTITPGVTYRTNDRAWAFTAAGVLGSDSSKYSILGMEGRIRYRATENISVRLSGAISHYSYTAPKTPRGGKTVTSAESVSPLGNSEAFDIANLGLEVSYTF
ncbi:MAG: hypothetical protein U1F27_05500 [Turneriella sp.]